MSSESDQPAAANSQKSYDAILEQVIREGLLELERPATGVFLSGLSAGLDIGFGPLLMAVVLSHSGPEVTPLIRELVVAGAYSLGFLFVVLGQSDLFTEHTVVAILPVMDGQATVGQLLREWTLVYVGNLTGCTLFAVLTVFVAPAIDIVEPGVFGEIADVLVLYSWWATLLSGVLAGWLMGLLSWLVVAGRDTIGEIAIIVLVTGAIGFAHLPHSIAGTVEVLLGVLSGSRLTVADYGGFLLWSTLGNVIGGVVFVALLKYSHVVRGGEEPVEPR